MGLIIPLKRGSASSTINGTTSSEYVDLVKDSDGFPLLRVYADGTVAMKGAKVVKLWKSTNLF